jgi:hypothetical protein
MTGDPLTEPWAGLVDTQRDVAILSDLAVTDHWLADERAALADERDLAADANDEVADAFDDRAQRRDGDAQSR